MFNGLWLLLQVKTGVFLGSLLLVGALGWRANAATDDWKNWYGVAWRGTPTENIKYARQMAYSAIVIQQYYSKAQYIGNQDYRNFKFFVIDPNYWAFQQLGYDYLIDTAKTYTQDQKNFYNKNLAWKSENTFPKNLATGWTYNEGTKFNGCWDLQQQRVIDMLIEAIITLFKSYEDHSLPFTFGGYMFDDTRLTGPFNYWNGTSNKQTTLANWTGTDSSLLHDGITHEYLTYTEAAAAYLKKLNRRVREEFPDAKWVMTPWQIYNPYNKDEWVYQIKDRADKNELIPDMISQEGPGVQFVDDSRIFTSGVSITKDMVATTQTGKIYEYENRLYAAKAGINGAWYSWFGLFGEGSESKNFQSIIEVYPRLKLVRVVPGWDNLNGVPLLARQWDGNIYRSEKSYISKNLIYSRHPKSGKLFVVFNNNLEPVRLPAGYILKSIQHTDGFFIETGDARNDFVVNGQEIALKEGIFIEKDSINGEANGKGYIMTTLAVPKSPSLVKTVIVDKQKP